MLEDVLDAALVVPGWDTWVLSPDEAVLEVAAGRGARAITEDEPPLAAAIHQAEDEALGRGADALAVVLPDTPLVTAGALTRALHTLGPVVVAPSTDERGHESAAAPTPSRDRGAVRTRLLPAPPRGRRRSGPADRRCGRPRARLRPRRPERYPHGARGAGDDAHQSGAPGSADRRTDGRARRRDLRRTGVQGTIKHYDEDSHRGSLLTDDRTEIAIDERSLADPSILLLRIGQRVRFEVEAAEDGLRGARPAPRDVLAATRPGPGRGTPCRR